MSAPSNWRNASQNRSSRRYFRRAAATSRSSASRLADAAAATAELASALLRLRSERNFTRTRTSRTATSVPLTTAMNEALPDDPLLVTDSF